MSGTAAGTRTGQAAAAAAGTRAGQAAAAAGGRQAAAAAAGTRAGQAAAAACACFSCDASSLRAKRTLYHTLHTCWSC